MGRNSKPIRWGIQQAAIEFGLSFQTMTTRLKTIQAGTDRKYSTRQIADVLVPRVESQRVRLLSLEADSREREERERAGELVPCAAVEAAWRDIVRTLRTEIERWNDQVIVGLPDPCPAGVLRDHMQTAVDGLLNALAVALPIASAAALALGINPPEPDGAADDEEEEEEIEDDEPTESAGDTPADTVEEST